MNTTTILFILVIVLTACSVFLLIKRHESKVNCRLHAEKVKAEHEENATLRGQLASMQSKIDPLMETIRKKDEEIRRLDEELSQRLITTINEEASTFRESATETEPDKEPVKPRSKKPVKDKPAKV